MQISKKFVAACRQAILDAGSVDEEALAEQFDITDAGDLQTLLDTVRKTYPDDFGVPEPDYKLKDENNILHDLEVVTTREGLVILQEKLPKDLVKVVVKGELVEVDLLALQRLRPDQIRHGMSVGRLISLAEAAKG